MVAPNSTTSACAMPVVVTNATAAATSAVTNAVESDLDTANGVISSDLLGGFIYYLRKQQKETLKDPA